MKLRKNKNNPPPTATPTPQAVRKQCEETRAAPLAEHRILGFLSVLFLRLVNWFPVCCKMGGCRCLCLARREVASPAEACHSASGRFSCVRGPKRNPAVPGKARGTLPGASQGALRVRGRHTQFCRGGKFSSLSPRGDTSYPRVKLEAQGRRRGLEGKSHLSLQG